MKFPRDWEYRIIFAEAARPITEEGIAEILMGAGMHCLGCMMSHFENLEQACAVHGIDADALVEQINEYLEAKGE